MRLPLAGEHPATGAQVLELPNPVLQQVLDCFPFYVMLVDARHHIVLANEAVRTSLGVAPDAILGGYCPKVVHGVEGKYPGCPLEQAVALGGQAVECNLFDDASGRTFVSAVWPTPYRTATGHDVYLHTTRDVTEQRAAEERERRSHDVHRVLNAALRLGLEPLEFDEVLRRILDLVCTVPWLSFSPRGGIFVFDDASETLILRASVNLDPLVEQVCGRVPSGECLCGRAAETKQLQFSVRADEDHRAGAHPPHGHYCVPILQADRILGVLNVYVRPGHTASASEIEFLEAIANVLAGVIGRRRAEALREASDHVAISHERLAHMGDVAAGVAHAIRDPLHGILNCVEILRARVSPSDPVSTEMVRLLGEGLARIDEVTGRLLDLAQDVAPTRRPADIGELLAEAQRRVAAQSHAKGVTVRIETPVKARVALDPERVGEALVAVIGNAIDASAAGGTVIVRALLAASAVPTLVVDVEDRGVGIAPDDLPRVLEPFFTRKPAGRGPGLGLAIAQQVMEQHGGTIEVRSRLGEGTRVRLTCPGTPLDADTSTPSPRG